MEIRINNQTDKTFKEVFTYIENIDFSTFRRSSQPNFVIFKDGHTASVKMNKNHIQIIFYHYVGGKTERMKSIFTNEEALRLEHASSSDYGHGDSNGNFTN